MTDPKLDAGEAVLAYCKWCENSPQTGKCGVTDCPLYPMRKREGMEATSMEALLDAIVARCDNCTGYETVASVRAVGIDDPKRARGYTRQGCTVEKCPLWTWRKGMVKVS